ncbi:hypothetical protein BKG82_24780 [Mycobacteroides chelonae]|uniref:Holin n=1 Tax=Mycobacteroides chelonae TaxID=1774 RepID=A0A1S1LDW6_MYCCH|nr:hypothetical protein [Mycobacteroides chelonae]OHU47590.1 hypothetical protein BKG82_24780 [Mycobacteroides chelonae]
MTKYTPGTIAKALVALVVATVGAATAAAHGADLSVLDIGNWLAALGAGLVAFGGVFAVPNKSEPAVDSPVDQVVNALPVVVDAVTQAQADFDRVKQAAADAFGNVPVVGPLAAQVIKSVTE